MSTPFSRHESALSACTVVITRPVGTGAALARRVSALGGVPVLLPGLALRGASDHALAQQLWREAQHDDVLIFTSPAAVRYAWTLSALDTHGTVIAVGQGTARALRQHGIAAQVPAKRQDSEGVLELPALREPHGRRVALITAPDGRGLLQRQLAERGALLREVHVYRRSAPRLTRRHIEAALHMPVTACVLLSSAEAVQNLARQLPVEAWRQLCRATAIVSSERIAEAARSAGFSRLHMAASANQADLLAAACECCSRVCHEASRTGC